MILFCECLKKSTTQPLSKAKPPRAQDVDMQEAHQQAQQQKPAAERSVSGSGQSGLPVELAHFCVANLHG